MRAPGSASHTTFTPRTAELAEVLGTPSRGVLKLLAMRHALVGLLSSAVILAVGCSYTRISDQLVRAGLPLPHHVSGHARAEYLRGRRVAGRAGCLACHRIGDEGNEGPGPGLSDVGDKLPRAAIAETLRHPVAPMPSYSSLPRAQFRALVTYLTLLRHPPGPRPGTITGKNIGGR